MGSGASTRLKSEGDNSKSPDCCQLITREIARLDEAKTDIAALDAFIKETRLQRTDDDKLANLRKTSASDTKTNKAGVPDTVEETVEKVNHYLDTINSKLVQLQETLDAFSEAVLSRYRSKHQEYTTENTDERIQQKIKVVDGQIMEVKERLLVMRKENNQNSIIEDLKHKLQELELQRETLVLQENDQSTSGLYDDKSGLNDRGLFSSTTVSKHKAELEQLKMKNAALIKEFETLKQDKLIAENKAEHSFDMVQKIKEKILEEKLSHEVEINSHKALLEQKDDRIAYLEAQLRLKNYNDRIKSVEKPTKEQNFRYKSSVKTTDSCDNFDLLTTPRDQGSDLDDPSRTASVRTESSVYLVDQSERLSPELSQERKEYYKTEISEKIETNDSRKSHTDNQTSSTEHSDSVVTKGSPLGIIQLHTNSPDSSNEADTTVINGHGKDIPDNTSEADMKTENNHKHQEQLKGDTESIEKQTIKPKEQLVNVQNNDFSSKQMDAYIRKQEEPKAESPEPDQEMKREIEPNLINDSNEDSYGVKNEEGDVMRPCSPNPRDDLDLGISDDDTAITPPAPSSEMFLYQEGMLKEIIYRRNDGEIDGNLSYHKGIGLVVRTKNKTFGVESIQCDIIDEIENEMLPDLVGGERTISFHLHIHKKYGTNLKYEGDDDNIKLFLPHRYLHDYEEAVMIYSSNGDDWEPCDAIDELPESIDTAQGIQLIGTELKDVTDVKVVIIAKEKVINLIAGENDIVYQSLVDPSVTVKMNTETFKSRTEVKLLVHHCHRREMLSAVEIHQECQCIMSCTPYVTLTCEQVARENFTVVMQLPQESYAECKYTMYSLEDPGWKLADCDWKEDENILVVRLLPGAKKYRILGVELPMTMSVEDGLLAVRTLHDHINHHTVRVLFRQKDDDPRRAVVICLGSKLVKQGIYELEGLGYSIGGFPSGQLCLKNEETLSFQFTGNITAKPLKSHKMELTFYSLKEIATKQLLLEPSNGNNTGRLRMLQGTINISRMGDNSCIILAETVHLPIH